MINYNEEKHYNIYLSDVVGIQYTDNESKMTFVAVLDEKNSNIVEIPMSMEYRKIFGFAPNVIPISDFIEWNVGNLIDYLKECYEYDLIDIFILKDIEVKVK